jgi:mannose-6-phosphate isomerase-like protein (cupin superfamily)
MAALDETGKTGLQPKVVVLSTESNEYIRVLGGPPETSTMGSGFVSLEPGKSVGLHSTGGYEEALVIFEGEGEMLFANNPSMILKAGSVAYCPPKTEHDVRNTGSGMLRYLYIVAKA